MRIVLTRYASQAGALESGVRRAGYEVAFMPLTQQVLPDDVTELRAAITGLESGEFSWLLLTSGNTVRAMVACGWNSAVLDQTRVGVVGPGTAGVLAELTGFRSVWMPQSHSAAGMLAELPDPQSGEQVLLPQSAQSRSELEEGLRARGWDVTHVTAYDTVPLNGNTDDDDGDTAQAVPRLNLSDGPHQVAQHLRPGDLEEDDVVLLTSSSAARAWAARLPPVPVCTLAIGAPTARTLRELGVRLDAVLPEPTDRGVLDSLGSLPGRHRPV